MTWADTVPYAGVSATPARIICHASTLAPCRGRIAFTALQAPPACSIGLWSANCCRWPKRRPGRGCLVTADRGHLARKVTRPGGPEPGTGLAAQSPSEHDCAAAREVEPAQKMHVLMTGDDQGSCDGDDQGSYR
jgi:hypothetical protein